MFYKASVSDLVSAQSLLPGGEFQVTGALLRFLCECSAWWNPLVGDTRRRNLMDELRDEQTVFFIFYLFFFSNIFGKYCAGLSHTSSSCEEEQRTKTFPFGQENQPRS